MPYPNDSAAADLTDAFLVRNAMADEAQRRIKGKTSFYGDVARLFSTTTDHAIDLCRRFKFDQETGAQC